MCQEEDPVIHACKYRQVGEEDRGISSMGSTSTVRTYRLLLTIGADHVS